MTKAMHDSGLLRIDIAEITVGERGMDSKALRGKGCHDFLSSEWPSERER